RRVGGRGRRGFVFEQIETALELGLLFAESLELLAHACGVFLTRGGRAEGVESGLERLTAALIALTLQHLLQGSDRVLFAAVAQGLEGGASDACVRMSGRFEEAGAGLRVTLPDLTQQLDRGDPDLDRASRAGPFQ